MRSKFDRKAMREELEKRTKESDERKEGGNYARYFKEDIEVPFVKFGVTKEEPHIIDIIPFIAGDKMPHFMKVKEGKTAYCLDIYVHQDIGGKWIVCPLKNYDEPCPICEYIDTLKKEGQEYEDYQELYPKRRCVYNVVNMTTVKEEKKGIQIWEVSHKYSERAIQSAAKPSRGGGSPIPFAHPDKEIGQSIAFNVEEGKYRTISGHKLVPRDYDIPDEILESALPLDQIIEILPYKEIKKIFDKSAGVSEDDDDDRGRGRNDDDDDVPNIDDDRGRGRGRNDDDDDDDDDDRGRGRGRGRNDDDDDDDRGRGRGKKVGECPDGGEFGEDIDKLSACDDCDVYRDCAKKADELERERKEKREKRKEDDKRGRRKI